MSVDYTVSGSGANPADAADFGEPLATNSVSFLTSETTKTITVLVSGDTLPEQDEDFAVTLSNPLGSAPRISDRLSFEFPGEGSNIVSTPVTVSGRTISASASGGSLLSVGNPGNGLNTNWLIHDQNGSAGSYAELKFDFDVDRFTFFYAGIVAGEFYAEEWGGRGIVFFFFVVENFVIFWRQL